jgi:hypothetical protein
VTKRPRGNTAEQEHIAKIHRYHSPQIPFLQMIKKSPQSVSLSQLLPKKKSARERQPPEYVLHTNARKRVVSTRRSRVCLS